MIAFGTLCILVPVAAPRESVDRLRSTDLAMGQVFFFPLCFGQFLLFVRRVRDLQDFSSTRTIQSHECFQLISALCDISRSIVAFDPFRIPPVLPARWTAQFCMPEIAPIESAVDVINPENRCYDCLQRFKPRAIQSEGSSSINNLTYTGSKLRIDVALLKHCLCCADSVTHTKKP